MDLQTIFMPIGKTININGKIEEPSLDPELATGRSFRYGDGVFETILVRNGHTLFLDDHLERLEDGLEIIGIDFQPRVFLPKIRQEVARTLSHMGETPFARVRVQVYRRGGGAYLPERDLPGYLIEASPLDEDPWDKTPAQRVGMFHHVPITPSPLTRIKSCNALPYILGARFAQSKGWDDALMRSSDGYVIESTICNLFIVHAATVFTPPVHGGCIPGIMRRNIIRILREKNVTVVEKHLTHMDLNVADEIFLTNAIRGVVKVKYVADTTFEPYQNQMIPYLKKWLREYRPPPPLHPEDN